MPDSEAEFLKRLEAAFRIEAAEHLQSISSGLIELEKNPADRGATIERIFRAAHSLKGAARSVDRRDIEGACQGLESIFARWKSGGIDAKPETFDELNAAVARLEAMAGGGAAAPAASAPLPVARAHVAAAPQPAGPPAPEAAPAVKRATPFPGVAAPPPVITNPEPIAATIRVPAARVDALLRQAEEMTGVKNSVRQRSADLVSLRRSIRHWRTDSAVLFRGQRTAPGAAADFTPFAEQMRGWLETCDSQLGRLQELLDQDGRALGGLLEDLLADAKTLAMLPFSTVLDPLPRQVRELARAQGKLVEVTLEGREIELDKRILEQIKDPLLHLVRNCVDHGIERPEIRRARGKPESGSLRIRVSYRSATQVEIEIRDDGAGIDQDRLKSAAVESGAITAEQAAAMPEPDALRLVFRSGVSTSGEVTEISGRGLGMAIVSERVQSLGGTVEVQSRTGKGARFVLLLPVTCATFSGLLIDCGRESMVAPIANVERAVRIKRNETDRTPRGESIRWRDEPIPLVRLRTILGIERQPGRLAPEILQVLIIASGDVRVALVVDEVHERMELLLKPFQRPIVHARHFAAASVLPSGRAVLILNIPEVIESAMALVEETAAAPAVPEPVTMKLARDILVVDDSVTSRMLIKNILESAGYRVNTASDGVNALAALRTQRFDLVVSDVQMPRMDGFDLTARIRADPQLGSLPVVLVTALDSPQDRARGTEAGASAYIVKSSFDQSNLLEIAGRLLS